MHTKIYFYTGTGNSLWVARQMDKDFRIDKECNSCGICKKVCPMDNIEITDNGPQWMHNCDQCFACLQWCPKQAIQTNKQHPNMRGIIIQR